MKFIIILSIPSIFAASVNAQISGTELRPKISRLANKLKKDDEVHFGYPVGFAGKPETNNKYYKKYLKLKSKATNDELVLLTKDDSKPIVIYAFSILHSRNYGKLKNIFLDHVDDTTFYWTASGCTGFIERVNWFMLRRLDPVGQSNGESYLTEKEYDLFCSEFKKQDTTFSCR